jgi:hypothetical protein
MVLQEQVRQCWPKQLHQRVMFSSCIALLRNLLKFMLEQDLKELENSFKRLDKWHQLSFSLMKLIVWLIREKIKILVQKPMETMKELVH